MNNFSFTTAFELTVEAIFWSYSSINNCFYAIFRFSVRDTSSNKDGSGKSMCTNMNQSWQWLGWLYMTSLFIAFMFHCIGFPELTYNVNFPSVLVSEEHGIQPVTSGSFSYNGSLSSTICSKAESAFSVTFGCVYGRVV